ncbi:type II toxin-antitoxin system PemK/MazF family toxin [Nocardia yamanashiensis]|uniref:type II toxin-antitoxin system PemK/MazF family toxin n=1 Tax=Nocardia yamanashiensis TaxID=209247 RepID=UPI001E317AAC|nr:type II toxin-antitoxin system PemK/MazF family toxin [Nocardia yamanashiensis]UGT43918.1 type II toxin-antitoxin system PemK/MazF family toxin [Nocardia yamanashiensis]
MAVLRGEIRSYLPGVSGRDKPSALSGERVLVISNDGANRAMQTAVVLPVQDRIDPDLAPSALSLVIPLGDLDPMAGGAVLAYWPKTIPIAWFTDPIGMVSKSTMRQVFAALVDYVGE